MPFSLALMAEGLLRDQILSFRELTFFFSFASGSEDGFIRLHHLDDDYFKRTEDLRSIVT